LRKGSEHGWATEELLDGIEVEALEVPGKGAGSVAAFCPKKSENRPLRMSSTKASFALLAHATLVSHGRRRDCPLGRCPETGSIWSSSDMEPPPITWATSGVASGPTSPAPNPKAFP